jgi:hypothetical protein
LHAATLTANVNFVDILKNPGFETGSAAPWTNGVIVDNANCRTSSYCGKVTAASPSSDQTITGLKANTTYTFSGHMKVAKAGERISIGVKNYGAAELYKDVTASNYTQASITFTTGANNTSAIVYMYKSSGSGAAWGDDFSLTTNGVVNAGFESGTVTPWVNGVIVDTTNCRTGSYCGKVTLAAPSSDQLILGLHANTTYTLSGYMKVAIAGERVSLGVKNYGGTEVYADVTATGYAPVSVTFTTGPSNTSAVVYMYKSSGNGAAWGDDFSLSMDATTPSLNPSGGLQNAGFESGNVMPWVNGVIVDKTNCRKGNFCGKVTQAEPSAEQTVNGLKPNTTYTFSGYLKAFYGGERVSLGVKNYGGAEVYADVVATSYAPATVTFTTGPNNTSAIVYMYKSSGPGAAWGDDFNLVANVDYPPPPPPPPPVTGLQNAGFESGVVAPWTSGVVIDKANCRTGAYCGKVTQSAPSSNQNITGLKPNTTYIFSGYMKTAGAAERVSIGVKGYGGTELYSDVTATNYMLTSVTFTTGANSTSAVVYMYKSSGVGPAWGDDFNLLAVAAPPPPPDHPPLSAKVPLGGPGGYTAAHIKLNDLFGSARAGANFTSLGQFNKGPYGSNGSGWDRWMAAYGQKQADYAQLTMLPDSLQLDVPTGANGDARFIVSHWECLPDEGNTCYIEIRVKTGRGGYDQGKISWPALWLFSGNEPGNVNKQSEFDFMETYSNLPDGNRSPDGYYYEAFRTAQHPSPQEGATILTTGTDVTTTYNVYGVQFRYAGGKVYQDVYFNGVHRWSSKTGLVWSSSPAAIAIGWNVGIRSANYKPMYLDYVRAWRK